ncbi:hypothetical protein [uncultured Sulfitobacter sp.]|uniref:hypothetical protein n=1 Tax=uncultured Sulfitobacter sp. TaxID=191468 RepID=UPI00262A64F8|nr:hypothetical protein [uncultured Sulfitobacter sp.]
MNYLRKRSIRLRLAAARRLRTIRKQLQKIHLSITIEINLVFLKITLEIGRRDE